MAKAKLDRKKNTDNLLRANPQVDSLMLSEVLALIDGLRSNGILGARYNLSSPFASRQQTTRTNMSRAETIEGQ